MGLLMNNLKSLRAANNKTQKQVANILGITQAAYAMYENGARSLPIDVIKTLADYFCVSVDYLLGRPEAPQPIEQPRFIMLYNSLSATQQEKVIAYMEGLLA